MNGKTSVLLINMFVPLIAVYIKAGSGRLELPAIYMNPHTGVRPSRFASDIQTAGQPVFYQHGQVGGFGFDFHFETVQLLLRLHEVAG